MKKLRFPIKEAVLHHTSCWAGCQIRTITRITELPAHYPFTQGQRGASGEPSVLLLGGLYKPSRWLTRKPAVFQNPPIIVSKHQSHYGELCPPSSEPSKGKPRQYNTHTHKHTTYTHPICLSLESNIGNSALKNF